MTTRASSGPCISSPATRATPVYGETSDRSRTRSSAADDAIREPRRRRCGAVEPRAVRAARDAVDAVQAEREREAELECVERAGEVEVAADRPAQREERGEGAARRASAPAATGTAPASPRAPRARCGTRATPPAAAGSSVRQQVSSGTNSGPSAAKRPFGGSTCSQRHALPSASSFQASRRGSSRGLGATTTRSSVACGPSHATTAGASTSSKRERGRDLRRQRALPDDAEPRRLEPLRPRRPGRRSRVEPASAVGLAARQAGPPSSRSCAASCSRAARIAGSAARAEARDDLRDGRPATVEERQQRRQQASRGGALEGTIATRPYSSAIRPWRRASRYQGRSRGRGGGARAYQQM